MERGTGALRYIASSEGGDQRDFAFAKVHFTRFMPTCSLVAMGYRGFQVEPFHRPSLIFVALFPKEIEDDRTHINKDSCFLYVLATEENFGTQVQCWSRNFWKSVRYLSEICQKTVSYKNVSENSHKCVRILSENCQMQISVRILSEKIWKWIRNVSDVCQKWVSCKIVSEVC